MGTNSLSHFFRTLETSDWPGYPPNAPRVCLILCSTMSRNRQIGCNGHEMITFLEYFTSEYQTDGSHNFTYTLAVEKVRKIDLPAGQYVTNCIKCTRTCHFPCSIPDDGNKWSCSAMDGSPSNAKCAICPGHCGWQSHANHSHRWEFFQEVETLFKRYSAAENGREAVKIVIKGLRNDIVATGKLILKMMIQGKKAMSRLGEIALRPDFLTTAEYIRVLIRAEEAEKKSGWEERRDAYKEAEAKAKRMEELKVANVEDLEQKMAFESKEEETDIEEWVRRLKPATTSTSTACGSASTTGDPPTKPEWWNLWNFFSS
jgi:hypothetical protein